MHSKSSLFSRLIPVLAATTFVQLVAGVPFGTENLGARADAADIGDIVFTYPHPWAHWNTNELHSISWEACSVPEGTTDTATIALFNSDELEEPATLATNVVLEKGRIWLTTGIPEVPPSDKYYLGMYIGTPGECGTTMACSATFKINLDQEPEPCED